MPVVPAKRLSDDSEPLARTKSRRPREARMVLAMAVSDWLYAVCSLRRLCHRAAGLHKRQHDACSHATGPCYAMLGPCAEALHHPVDLCHWAVWLHLRESVFFFFRLLRFKPPKPGESAVLHAHVMLAVVSSLAPSNSPALRQTRRTPVRLLLASENPPGPWLRDPDSCDALCCKGHWSAARPAC